MMNPQIDVREIRHFHLFCGLGGGARGFNRANPRIPNMMGRMRCIGGIDVDAAAVRDFGKLAGVQGTVLDLFDRTQYEAFHGALPPDGWRPATPDDIRRAAGGERPHIVFLSAPCLPADGLVLTETGPRAISTIRVGEQVLTHKGRLRSVTAVGTEPYHGTMHGVRLNGTVDRQWFTDDHPLWVRRVIRPLGQRTRRLSEPVFLASKHLKLGDRVGFPIEQATKGTASAFVLSLGNPQEVEKGGKATVPNAKSQHVAIVDRIIDLRPQAADPNLWFLLGAYLGDGYRRNDAGKYVVNFCVGHKDGRKARLVRQAIDLLGLSYRTDEDAGPTNIKVQVTGKHLHTICGQFGDGASNKRLPPAIFSIEDELLEQLIDGYRETDGSYQPRRKKARGNTLQARWRIASVSLQMLRDFQRLLLRNGTFAKIHVAWPGGPQVIEGRNVQTLPRWELDVSLDPIKRTVFEFIDDTVWVRVRDIVKEQRDEPVWNLSVDEDDTFCAPMMATHNCKGFSGLLSESKSLSSKYQALNRLTVRGLFLTMEAFADDPPELILFENVPRIAVRGRPLLNQITGLLRSYGYEVRETAHDCGAIGGMAQSRKRFLMVARHAAKVPPFLRVPPMRPLRGVGTVLDHLPLPGGGVGGPMHRIPSLRWQTWVRLAFVEAGGDWRSLNKLAVQADGYLRDFLIVPEMHNGVLGVNRWGDPSCTVAGRSGSTNNAYNVADPRFSQSLFWNEGQQYGVVDWGKPAPTIAGQQSPGQGRYAVADPRHHGPEKHSNEFRIAPWNEASASVTGAHGSGQCVADPRPKNARQFENIFRVVHWDHHARSVIGKTQPSDGAMSVADPRWHTSAREQFTNGGHYGVVPWDSPANTVSGSACLDNGRWSVADPRPLPAITARLTCIIRSLDSTWHRPFTTLELAALQGLVNPEEFLELDGLSDQAWRERIGNAVPPDAAQAIAEVMGRTLLLAWSGTTFELSSEPIWVKPLAIALTLPGDNRE